MQTQQGIPQLRHLKLFELVRQSSQADTTSSRLQASASRHVDDALARRFCEAAERSLLLRPIENQADVQRDPSRVRRALQAFLA